MRHIDFEFNGRPLALSFTAEALFAIYEKYGVCDDILAATGAFEPTQEGFVSLCWLVALMASEGELQRRHRGEAPREMITLEDVRTGAMASDLPRLRQAVRDALEQGFSHEPTEAETRAREINLVLQTREEAAKKLALPVLSALDTLHRQLASLVSRRSTPSS